jgi:hypothetical protein
LGVFTRTAGTPPVHDRLGIGIAEVEYPRLSTLDAAVALLAATTQPHQPEETPGSGVTT